MRVPAIGNQFIAEWLEGGLGADLDRKLYRREALGGKIERAQLTLVGRRGVSFEATGHATDLSEK